MSPIPPGHSVLAAPAVDEVDQRVADALDRRNVEFHRARLRVEAPCAEFERPPVGERGVLDAKCDRADRRPVQPRKALREGIRFRVDDEVHAALPVQRHVLVTMPGDGDEPHAGEQAAQRGRVGCRVFDELEAVGSHRVVPRRELHRLTPLSYRRQRAEVSGTGTTIDCQIRSPDRPLRNIILRNAQFREEARACKDGRRWPPARDDGRDGLPAAGACGRSQHFSRFVMDQLLRQPGVVDVKSSFALARIKETTALPLNPARAA